MKKTKVNSNNKLSTSKKEIIKKSWYYLFLILFFVAIVFLIYSYINEETMFSHFSYMTTNATNNNDSAIIYGEYKTTGSGFVVGNKISIYVIMKFKYPESYQKQKNYLKFTDNLVFIENSENPEDAIIDISKNFENISFVDAGVNSGVLKVVEFLDENNTIKFKGDVVFTKEGYLGFYPPLSLSLGHLAPLYVHNKEGYFGFEPPINIDQNEKGIYVSPIYVKYQIESNKRIEHLTIITVAVSFLALFFGFRNQKET